MTKTVKEFLLDHGTGEVDVEYSDNTTTSFNLANAVTATQSGTVDGSAYGGIQKFPAGTASYLNRATGNRVVVVGNSKTEQFGYTGNITRQTDISADVWAQVHLDSRLEFVNNAGIGGELSGQMLARFEADVLAYAPSWVFARYLDNDIHSGSYNADTSKANVLAMLAAAHSIGARTLLYTVTPTTSANTNWLQARVTRMYDINRWLKSLPALYPHYGIVVADVSGLMVDPLVTGAQPKANWTQADDGIHETALSAYYEGKYIASLLSPFIPPISRLPQSVSDAYPYNASGDIISNDPLMQATGGTNSASTTVTATVVPGSWTLSKTGTWGASKAVSNVADRADGFGKDWVCTITAAGADGDRLMLNSQSYISRVTPGVTQIRGLGAFDVSGLSKMRGVAFYVECDSAALGTQRGSIIERNAGDTGDTFSTQPQESWAKELVTGWLTVPADATYVKLIISIRCGDATSTAVVKAGRLAIQAR